MKDEIPETAILNLKCPQCHSEANVYMLDKGVKFMFHLMSGNNRFVCQACQLSWREKQPNKISKLKEKSYS
jgi:transposase-like protein